MLNFFEQVELKEAKVLLCRNYIDLNYSDFDKEIKWEIFPVKVHGKVFDQPRECCYIADENFPYRYSGYSRKPLPWTKNLKELCKLLNDSIKQLYPKHKNLNAVLCNKYRDGKDYIGFHSDDERDLVTNSFIASISIGASRDFIFKHKNTSEKIVIPLNSGDLILMGENCQKNYKHSVPKRLKVKEPRINLTFRSVKN